MKLIEYGTQPGTWASKVYDCNTGKCEVELHAVIEHYFRLYLPWKRKIFVINVDDVVYQQPCWSVYWHAHPSVPSVHFARWAWQ